MKTTIELAGIWDFRREDAAGWTKVRVPHDWAIAGPFDPEGEGQSGKLPWRGKGEYRRTFDLGADAIETLRLGGRAYLELEGALSSPRVFLNGADAGGWDYGYMGVTLDVTDKLRPGRNDVAVTCDTTKGYSRFYCGGGLFRPLRLKVLPAEHVVPNSLAITTPVVTPECATVLVSYETPAKGKISFSFDIAHPKLWSPESPFLHEVEILGEKFRYGIRTARFTADDGFHLNGRRLQLKGVCLHSDLGLLGMAFTRAAAARHLKIMKDMGANAIRTSHNAVAPEFLDLCDEMGFVVWDECFDKWDGSALRAEGADGLDEFVTRNLKAFVRRDRNHPSVVAWSIGNEIGPADDAFPTGVTRERCRAYREAILAEDATRAVGIGAWQKETCDCFLDLDVTGWNYARRYMPMKRLAPDKPIVYTESGSSFSDFGYYRNPPAAYRTDYAVDVRKTSGYDHVAAWYSDIPDVEFHRMEKDRFVAGEFTWTGIDYLGEPSPYYSIGWPAYLKGVDIPEREMARSSYYGAVDLSGVPKDRFFLFRSYWNETARTVHILPHWNWAPGQVVPVYAYTDGDEAELFLNGKSLGRRRKLADVDFSVDHDIADNTPRDDFRDNPYYRICDKYRLRWCDVAWEPGELTVVAYKNGERIGEASVKTAGMPVALRLAADPYTNLADELVFVQVDAVDAQGVRDPFATRLVSFEVSGAGEIAACGNGDPRSYRAFSEKRHELYFGKAVVILRRTGPGRIVLQAAAEGLAPAAFTLTPLGKDCE